jgi:hypothetical protein
VRQLSGRYLPLLGLWTYASCVGWYRAAIVITMLLLVCGCGSSVASGASDVESRPSSGMSSTPSPSRCSSVPSAELSSKYAGTLRLEPRRVHRGEVFKARFPQKARRTTILLMLASRHGPCRAGFLLSAEDGRPRASRLPNHGAFTTLGAATRRVAVRGLVPPTAPPGQYSVCDETGHACALLLVER